MQHFYRVPARRQDNGVVPDLAEVDDVHPGYVAEYDSTTDTFVIGTDDPMDKLDHRKVERPAHGVHAPRPATAAAPAEPPGLRAARAKLHGIQSAALARGEDPTKVGVKEREAVLALEARE